jgi:hypothetical protein
VTKELTYQYIEDLMFRKTAEGLEIEDLILKEIAKECQANNFRHGETHDNESKGKDIFINEVCLSIKPESYNKFFVSNLDIINEPLVYYKKTKKGTIKFAISNAILNEIRGKNGN